MFNTNKKRKSLEKKLTSHPHLITITSSCIKVSLEMYVSSLREYIRITDEEYRINWSEENLSTITSILLHVCNFTVPSVIYMSFKNKDVAELYIDAWMQCETDKDIDKVYKYFQSILDKYKVNILGLFPIAVGLEHQNFLENITKDENMAQISTRAISFTNDLVTAFCTQNPIMEGFSGEYAAQMAMRKKNK